MHSKIKLLKRCHLELTAQGTLKKKDQTHKVSLSLLELPGGITCT